jgi:hypothetical protein
MDGGPSFISVTGQFESNADINAAVNIGLRAVAHPDCLDVFPVFRVKVKNDGTLELQKPKRGIYALANAELELSPAKAKSDNTTTTESVFESNASDEDEDESESENISYLFALSQNAFSIRDEERYDLPKHERSVAATTKIFWSRVKAETLKQIREINRARIEKWERVNDDIPM